MIVFVGVLLHENKKYYPDKKRYIMIELTFLKELISIKQVHQKSVIFVTNV